MRIATWNINSVRLRAPIVQKILQEQNLDILCLQETKVVDELFPTAEFEKIGYKHIYFTGQKSYNGVCVISRIPLELDDKKALVNEDARHISVKFKAADGKQVTLHNFYIPAGGDIPDVNENPKFQHKLDYNNAMAKYLQSHHKPSDNVIILGDFNIAPYENDVWSHKQLLKIVSHTPIEVEHLARVKASLNFSDIARDFVPETERLYSWWSYRNKDWKKSNRGRRLDHIWCTAPLKNSIKKFDVIPEARDLTKPSDHVPVIIELG